MAVAVYLVIGAAIFAGAPLILAFFYFLTLHRTLNEIAPERRRMAPPMVWLAAIPGVNLVWCFFNGIEIPASIRSECITREMDDGTSYGQGLGVANAVLNLANHLLLGVWYLELGRAGGAPWFGRMLSLALGGCLVAGGVVFFKFWIRMAMYGERLRRMNDMEPDAWPASHLAETSNVNTEDAIQSDAKQAFRPKDDPNV